MKRKVLSLVVAGLLVVGMSGPALADLVQQPSSQFVDPSLAGLGNLLIPEFLNIPVEGTLGSTDCLFGGELRIDGDAAVSVHDAGYAIFFDGAGLVPLVVEGGGYDLAVDGTLTIVADDCEIIPFIPISFSMDIFSSEITADQAYIAFVSTPYLNTDTDKIVLATDPGSILAIAGIELLPDLFGLEEFVEGLLEQWISNFLADELYNQGTLAVTGDGGAVHDALEDAMDGIYLPHMCGCVTVTQGKPTTGHLLVNTCLYLLPVGLILGLRRRWTKR